MKKLLVLFGVILILPWQLISQESEYVSKQELQAEKSQILRSIYSLNKNNKELQAILLFEVRANDSLAELVTLQSADMKAQKELLQKLEASQTDLDSRLMTQRKSGTLMVILIPAALFLLFLLLLIWLIIFRHRTLSVLNHVDDRLNELSKKNDDRWLHYEQQQNAFRAELNTSVKQAETRFQKLFSETEEKLQRIETIIKEDQSSHEVRHNESHKEFEAFKGSLQKGYDSLTADLTNLKEELSATAKEFTSKLKEIIKKHPG